MIAAFAAFFGCTDHGMLRDIPRAFVVLNILVLRQIDIAAPAFILSAYRSHLTCIGTAYAAVFGLTD